MKRLLGIDHNYIENIGRQMVVTGYDPAVDVTISKRACNSVRTNSDGEVSNGVTGNNIFDGRVTYSAT